MGAVELKMAANEFDEMNEIGESWNSLRIERRWIKWKRILLLDYQTSQCVEHRNIIEI